MLFAHNCITLAKTHWAPAPTCDTGATSSSPASLWVWSRSDRGSWCGRRSAAVGGGRRASSSWRRTRRGSSPRWRRSEDGGVCPQGRLSPGPAEHPPPGQVQLKEGRSVFLSEAWRQVQERRRTESWVHLNALSEQLTPAALFPPPLGQWTWLLRRHCWMESSVPTQWVPLSITSLALGSLDQYQVSYQRGCTGQRQVLTSLVSQVSLRQWVGGFAVLSPVLLLLIEDWQSLAERCLQLQQLHYLISQIVSIFRTLHLQCYTVEYIIELSLVAWESLLRQNIQA